MLRASSSHYRRPSQLMSRASASIASDAAGVLPPICCRSASDSKSPRSGGGLVAQIHSVTTSRSSPAALHAVH